MNILIIMIISGLLSLIVLLGLLGEIIILGIKDLVENLFQNKENLK